MATLPEAGWVSESATEPEGVKPQSKATWSNRTLVATTEEAPISDNLDELLASIAEEAEAGEAGQTGRPYPDHVTVSRPNRAVAARITAAAAKAD